MAEPPKLQPFHLDALREMGNVGAGNAATALSQLLNRRVEMNVAQVTLVSTDSLGEYLGEHPDEVAAVQIPVYGEARAKVLIFFDLDRLGALLSLLLGRPAADPKDLSELERSAVQEISSILTGAYLNAINGLIHVQLIHGLPSLAFDRADAVLQSILMEFEQNQGWALVIETEFSEAGHILAGKFILIPEGNALDLLLRAFYRALGISPDA
jgi:chemotaxis protein CheC